MKRKLIKFNLNYSLNKKERKIIIKDGSKILAISEYRYRTRCSLAESMIKVEEFLSKLKNEKKA